MGAWLSVESLPSKNDTQYCQKKKKMKPRVQPKKKKKRRKTITPITDEETEAERG
jgi:hypothetical protein